MSAWARFLRRTYRLEVQQDWDGTRCDLLIAHQDELEAWLAAFFGHQQPEVVGNAYLVVGTEERAAWRRGRILRGCEGR